MKILFTDLDGTLLNNASKVSSVTKAFLDEFTATDNRLVLSSGRPLDSILEVKNLAGIDVPGVIIVANNGALIYDCDSQTAIREIRLPIEYVSYLSDKAYECGIHIQTYTDSEIVCRQDDEEIRYYTRKIHLPIIYTDDYASVLTIGPYKMLAANLSDKQKLIDFAKSVEEWAAGKVSCVFSNDRYLEFFDYRAGKGSAVRFVCDYFNIPISDAFAAGDAENDISMIEAAGCGIAMLNSTEAVKKAASIVTEYDNDSDGLCRCLRGLLDL